ncbi:hypothetical protein EXM22_15630 [Oceanispirochaeta crateris]|uniref:Uncharacterized protein n=1 Tax=Oceanispirochaeta crateris TaxID=2518645 RepID=A0A5C1QS03_9SPIO|nr:hypothetical protein [Oceanispirochaeta crateris]QEN09336.1 hypothetical protein EXM22_15630 [Oceanispirochaeta crateris]
MKNIRILTDILIALLLILFLASCATRGKTDPHAPDWYSQIEESENSDGYIIKISGASSSEKETLDQVIQVLYDRIMEISGQSALYSQETDKAMLLGAIRQVILKEESSIDEFLSVIQQEWVIPDDQVLYYGAFLLKKDADDFLQNLILQRYYNDDEALKEMLESSSVFESELKYYSAAEELIRAAQYVLSHSEPLADEIAQGYVDRAGVLLNKIFLKKLGAPDSVLSNLKISDPFHILCETEEELGIGGVEFLVRYQGRKRDGSRGEFERRLISNLSGIMEFFHPFIPFSGKAEVQFKPGSRDFHAGISNLEKLGMNVTFIKKWLEESTIDYELDVASGARTVSMGVVILHTDSTGAALSQQDSSVSLQEALSQDGFNIRLMNLNPREIMNKTEAEFIRDLRALYKGEYTRVAFGVVGIRDFETRNDSYRVNTSGTVKVVDVDSGEILLVLDLDKSVESRSNTLAVSASFRELGKSFAEEMMSYLE